MKRFYTRKQFANHNGLSSMRKSDPIQFEVLFVAYCREKNLSHYSKTM